MADSSTERSRRRRAHAKGDHSLCKPDRCRHALGSAEPEPVEVEADEPELAEAPYAFGPRGARLWREMTIGALTPSQRVLVEEACRIADRLDRLDRALAGDVFEVAVSPFGEMHLIVTGPLAEARMQATALKGVLAELRQQGGAGAASKAGNEAADKGVHGVSDLTARIAARRPQASA